MKRGFWWYQGGGSCIINILLLNKLSSKLSSKFMTTREIGNLGEKITEQYLKKKGYKILDRNYSNNFASGPIRGEIDIIAKPRRNVFDILRGKKDDTVHFIEVKTLSSGDNSFLPEDRVDFNKQRRIIIIINSNLGVF